MQQLTTRLYTWLVGDVVGIDEFGNRYFRGKGRKLHGRERRWVIYKGDIEASRIPPEWHVWLHHTTLVPLTEDAAKALSWQKEHQPNLTGTPAAYLPAGHDLSGGVRAPATGDYQPWKPG